MSLDSDRGRVAGEHLEGLAVLSNLPRPLVYVSMLQFLWQDDMVSVAHFIADWLD